MPKLFALYTQDAKPVPPLAGRREWLGLVVLALPLLLASMDISVLYFAVPSITRDLHADATQQLWIFDVYGLVLAGLLLTMGALGDRVGRRRLLLFGALTFSIASVAAAWSHNPEQLIAARAALGVGGATLMPSTLALIRTMFRDQQQRSRAIGIWSAVTVAGVALGPVLSGVLIERFWWGSVFLINVPFMVGLVALGPVILPESQRRRGAPFDIAGALLSLLAVLSLVYGIQRASGVGLDAVAVAALVFGAAAGVAFVGRERVATEPIVRLALLRDRHVSGALGSSTLAMFAIIGSAVFLTQWLQLVHGLSPLAAALWSIAPSLAVGGAAPAAQAVGQRFGAARVLCGGFLVGGCGAAVLTQLRAGSGLSLLVLAVAVMNCGLVSVASIATEAIVSAVPARRAGEVSAVLETGNELGGALGIAVLGSIGAALYRHSLSQHVPHASATLRADGLAAAHGAVLETARQAFCAGLDLVALVVAGLLGIGAVASAVTMRGASTGTPAADCPADNVVGVSAAVEAGRSVSSCP